MIFFVALMFDIVEKIIKLWEIIWQFYNILHNLRYQDVRRLVKMLLNFMNMLDMEKK